MKPMRSLSMLALALGLANAACASETSGSPDAVDDAAELREDDPATLLTASYDEWKQRFAARAARWRSVEPRTEVGRLPVPTADDASLAIDYVYVPATSKATNLVVMNSGIHGVEAPAGVLFQDVLLGECATGSSIDRSETAILVIHVMNPSGAKYGRRFNDDNVDLNRNFFDAQTNQGAAFEGRSIVNNEYRDLRHLLEGGRISIFDIVAAWLRHGSAEMTKALSGQYEFPQGIYYGGSEVEREGVAVQQLLLRVVEPFKNVAIIDMHTGLGKNGINQIMNNPLEPGASSEVASAFAREVKMLQNMFPPAECADLCEVQLASEPGDPAGQQGTQSFVTTGDFTQWIHKTLPQKRIAGTVVSVTSEIGTTSSREVLEGLVDENYCQHERAACGEGQYQSDVARLRRLFNPSSAQWKDKVVRSARQMCTALGRFSKER